MAVARLAKTKAVKRLGRGQVKSITSEACPDRVGALYRDKPLRFLVHLARRSWDEATRPFHVIGVARLGARHVFISVEHPTP